MPALWAFEVLVVNEVIKQLKVLDSIIITDAVKMVNALTPDKVAPNMFLHDQPVFSDVVGGVGEGVFGCVDEHIAINHDAPTPPRMGGFRLGPSHTFGGTIQVRIGECVILFGAKFLPTSFAIVDGYLTSGLGVFISARNPSPYSKYSPAFKGTRYPLRLPYRRRQYGCTAHNARLGGLRRLRRVAKRKLR